MCLKKEILGERERTQLFCNRITRNNGGQICLWFMIVCTASVSGVEILFRDSLSVDDKGYQVQTDQAWTRALQRERVIHIDFREHNTNQIGSELFPRISYSVSNFFSRVRWKVFWIFETKHLTYFSCITGISEVRCLR